MSIRYSLVEYIREYYDPLVEYIREYYDPLFEYKWLTGCLCGVLQGVYGVYDCDPVVPYLLEMINEHLQPGTERLWNVIRSGERTGLGQAGPLIIEQWVESSHPANG